MLVYVSPTFAEIQGRVPLQLFRRLEEGLRYRPDGYQHTPSYKAFQREELLKEQAELQASEQTGEVQVKLERIAKRLGFLNHEIGHMTGLRPWDGYNNLLKQMKYTLVFPSGLLHRVIALASDLDVQCDILPIDLPRLEPADVVTILADGKTLYADQQEALRYAVEHQRGLLALAPNFGKTELAAAIFATFPKEPGLIIVNRRILLDQTAKRLSECLGEPVARLGSGHPGGRSRITVAMAQTLLRLHKKSQRTKTPPKALTDARILIVDEVHTAVTPKTWFPILGACLAPFRIGMSGTVREVHNQLPLEAFFGPILHTVTETQLVAAGRSAEPIILMPAAGAVINETRDYKLLYEEGIVRNNMRNELLVKAVLWAAEKGLRSLILFYRIEHGETLHRMLHQAGVKAALVHGKTHPDSANQAKEDLTEKRISAIVASTVGNVGWDLAAVEVLVNAGAWKSPLATRQKLGRALRRKLEGENRAIVIDPWDYGARLLKRHSEARERLYRQAGFPPKLGTLEAVWAEAT